MLDDVKKATPPIDHELATSISEGLLPLEHSRLADKIITLMKTRSRFDDGLMKSHSRFDDDVLKTRPRFGELEHHDSRESRATARSRLGIHGHGGRGSVGGGVPFADTPHTSVRVSLSDGENQLAVRYTRLPPLQRET